MATATTHSNAPFDVDDVVAARSPRGPQRTIDHRRLSGWATRCALTAVAVAAAGYAAGALVVGRLAETPSWGGIGVLALCLIGAAITDTFGRVLWNTVVDRAEGQLRTDLLDAVMSQPVGDLSEQAVGEVLDRIDDDTHELGTLLRMAGWRIIRLTLVAIPLLLVAGFTWWPAWLLFPATTGAIVLLIRRLMVLLAQLKVAEEAAWTDHAAALEEGIAARDDLRSSMGQAYAVRRCAELAAAVHARMDDVVAVETRIMRRAGLMLHGLLATVAVFGAALVMNGSQSTATLVTLFAVTVTFVGQADQVAHQVTDIQAGVGALIRLRAVMASDAEPVGGRRLADDQPLAVEFHDVHFAYPHGEFSLDGVSLNVAAGTTCALVGRSGSGKSTLASLLSRAVDPERGTVFLGGVDVVDLDLHELRSTVGLVTQRTEIIAGTLAQNIAMFDDTGRSRIVDAIDELGLADWVEGLPDGLDTMLGPAGTSLSAGEQQLVAFARLLVRDVGVIVLDEATARMDPVTEEQVVAASRRLLAGRTGILIAHRLSTVERADYVAVLDGGRIIQHGARAHLVSEPGAFRRLLDDAGEPPANTASLGRGTPADREVGGVRRQGTPPPALQVQQPPTLATGIWSAVRIHPEWGLVAVAFFLTWVLLGAYGAVSGWIWGNIVVDLEQGQRPTGLLVALVASFVVAPIALAAAVRRFPHWWIAVLLRVRTSVLVGQTNQRRLAPTPPGEVVARAMDCDRYTRYADRWIDFVNGLILVTVTALLGGTALAGGVLLAVMLTTAVTSRLGSPSAGRTAAAASTARAEFGRALVSALDSIRTVKLAAATAPVHQHLRRVDNGRVDAAVREHRVQSLLDGVPVIMVQAGVVAAWAIYVAGGWGLATALLVAGTVGGFEWFGRVAGAVITEAPGTRAWHQEISRLAGGAELMDLPAGVNLVTGSAPRPAPSSAQPLEKFALRNLSVIHDDGTIGVHGIDLDVRRGELVLVVGRIGSGKSSLLAALAGLVRTTGDMRWNQQVVEDPETFLRPGRVAYVAQVPRVLSGNFADNVSLDHDCDIVAPIELAQLSRDIADAGGIDALVGHRGVRLSGGQVQRLALARSLATGSELLVADDVSSALDATTEVELWESLRASGRTVIGATTKHAALAAADRVVVLVDGTVAAQGTWRQLEARWGQLAG